MTASPRHAVHPRRGRRGEKKLRGRARRTAAALAALGWACSPSTGPNPPPPPPPPPPSFALATEVVADGLQAPVFLTAPPGDGRLFIVEQGGLVRVVSASDQLLSIPFLDLRSKITTSCSEQGLLSLAFHPRFASNGFVYVNYTRGDGDTVIERYTVGSDPDRADPASAAQILQVPQTACNHNGGLLLFGPDGMLYAFLGDGGGAGDPAGNGQDAGTLLGGVLRLDVDGGAPFAVPPDNPFVGGPGRDELWAIGLRNPWRASFDPVGGHLYIADVGQNAMEEVNAVPADRAGVNYGWNLMEGSACFAAGSCDTSGLTLPVEEYPNPQAGCSITGGYVYRGSAIPEIQGTYFYSDFCSGFLRSFRLVGGQARERLEWNIGNLGQVSSFGVDGAGELYVLDIGGAVRRIVRGSSPNGASALP